MEKVLERLKLAFPILYGERLILRRLEQDDIPLMSRYMLDSRVRKFVNFTEGMLRVPSRMLNYFEESYDNLNDIHFVVALPLSMGKIQSRHAEQARADMAIGLCSLQFWDRRANRAKLGYLIAPEYWNHGYATEAARMVLSFGFDTLQLEVIEARCQVGNIASESVLQRCGMLKEMEGMSHSKMRYHVWRTHAIRFQQQYPHLLHN